MQKNEYQKEHIFFNERRKDSIPGRAVVKSGRSNLLRQIYGSISAMSNQGWCVADQDEKIRKGWIRLNFRGQG